MLAGRSCTNRSRTAASRPKKSIWPRHAIARLRFCRTRSSISSWPSAGLPTARHSKCWANCIAAWTMLSKLELPETVRREATAYHLHPALGDGLLQLVAGAVPLEDDGSFSPFTYMPVAIRSVRVVSLIEDD